MRWTCVAAASLAAINTSLVLWDVARAAAPVYAVSLPLTGILILFGLLAYFIQHHFVRLVVAVNKLEPKSADDIAMELSGLRRWLAVLGSGLALTMLLCLTGIVSRFNEGYPLFD